MKRSNARSSSVGLAGAALVLAACQADRPTRPPPHTSSLNSLSSAAGESGSSVIRSSVSISGGETIFDPQDGQRTYTTTVEKHSDGSSTIILEQLRLGKSDDREPYPVGARVSPSGKLALLLSNGEERPQDPTGNTFTVDGTGTNIFSGADSVAKRAQFTFRSRANPQVAAQLVAPARMPTRITKSSGEMRLRQLQEQFPNSARLDSSRVQFTGVREGRSLRLVFDERIGAQTELALAEPSGAEVQINYEYTQLGADFHLTREVTLAKGPFGVRTFTRSFDLPANQLRNK